MTVYLNIIGRIGDGVYVLSKDWIMTAVLFLHLLNKLRGIARLFKRTRPETPQELSKS